MRQKELKVEFLCVREEGLGLIALMSSVISVAELPNSGPFASNPSASFPATVSSPEQGH